MQRTQRLDLDVRLDLANIYSVLTILPGKSSALHRASGREVAGEARAQEARAPAEVVHADGDGRPLAVLDAHPAREAGAGERREDPVVVVEAIADHAVLDGVALQPAIRGVDGRDARQHALQQR